MNLCNCKSLVALESALDIEAPIYWKNITEIVVINTAEDASVHQIHVIEDSDKIEETLIERSHKVFFSVA
jgi:hypothetical protein